MEEKWRKGKRKGKTERVGNINRIQERAMRKLEIESKETEKGGREKVRIGR